MPTFEGLFRKSNAKPVVYEGKTIHLFDCLKVADGQIITLTFESVNADWRQGVELLTDGSFEVLGHSGSDSVVLWQDTAPQKVALRVHTKKGECSVMNVWDTGNGLMQQGHNGAAMLIEATPTGKRYRCNDGVADDDFDDLVFRIDMSLVPTG